MGVDLVLLGRYNALFDAYNKINATSKAHVLEALNARIVALVEDMQRTQNYSVSGVSRLVDSLLIMSERLTQLSRKVSDTVALSTAPFTVPNENNPVAASSSQVQEPVQQSNTEGTKAAVSPTVSQMQPADVQKSDSSIVDAVAEKFDMLYGEANKKGKYTELRGKCRADNTLIYRLDYLLKTLPAEGNVELKDKILTEINREKNNGFDANDKKIMGFIAQEFLKQKLLYNIRADETPPLEIAWMILDGIGDASELQDRILQIHQSEDLFSKLCSNFDRVNVLDDGNCFFHAIAAQVIPDAKKLYLQGPIPHSKQQEFQQIIRDQLVAKMKADMYSAGELERVVFSANIKEILAQPGVERGAHWGNETDCKLISEIYNRPVHIYAPGYVNLNRGYKVYCKDSNAKLNPPIILFTDGAVHWQFMVPKSASSSSASSSSS